MRKIADFLLIAALVIMIAVPVALLNTKPDQVSVSENRTLAQPEWGYGINHFMQTVSDSIDDRIGLRSAFMSLYNTVVYDTLHSKHTDVIDGEDGWLFYINDIPDYAGTNINDATIAHYVNVLTAIDQWCKARDIEFVLWVGPNKSAVYDNCMPDGIKQAETNRTELILQRLREAGVKVSYEKDTMIAHRDDQELYYKLDTHWNSYAARYTIEDVLTQLGLPVREFEYIATPVIEGDLMTMLGTGYNGVYSLEVETVPNPEADIEALESDVHHYIHNPKGEKFMCYRDSFGRVTIPMYSYYFTGHVFWDFNIDFDLVEQEAPKVLILSCVERFFDTMVISNEDILTRE